jgi:thiol:disulfide interchange protein
VPYYIAALVCVIGGWFLAFSGNRSVPRLLEAHRRMVLGPYAASHPAGSSADGVQAGSLPTGFEWTKDEIPWLPYTRQRALDTVKAGHTIFVDYTADWCVNCKTIESLVIDTDAVRGTMKKLGVVPFKADYTLKDPQITEDLERFGRSGVPMYVIYPAGKPDQPILLDTIPTKSSVIRNLEKAGPSTPATAGASPEHVSLRSAPAQGEPDAYNRAS